MKIQLRVCEEEQKKKKEAKRKETERARKKEKKKTKYVWYCVRQLAFIAIITPSLAMACLTERQLCSFTYQACSSLMQGELDAVCHPDMPH